MKPATETTKSSSSLDLSCPLVDKPQKLQKPFRLHSSQSGSSAVRMPGTSKRSKLELKGFLLRVLADCSFSFAAALHGSSAHAPAAHYSRNPRYRCLPDASDSGLALETMSTMMMASVLPVRYYCYWHGWMQTVTGCQGSKGWRCLMQPCSQNCI